MKKINDRLLSWASIIEENTLEQAVASSQMPFIFPHIALMPDAHLGRGATVGSVIPTRRAIMPAAVGVDIGCGMAAVRTQFTADDLDQLDLKALHAQISRSVPLSAGARNRKLHGDAEGYIAYLETKADAAGIILDTYSKDWRLQLGTLGSGNHFIEVSLDEQDRVWFFLHTGSRGVGNRIATFHTKVAQQLCNDWHIQLPDRDLAYIPEGPEQFWQYIREMRWAQEFARLNRELIMDRVVNQFERLAERLVERVETINCHHNYTTQEKHFGKEVWLSRKGAINAEEGARGLIPGSMGAASYVVTGKGNPVALNSSPHGAGRNFSRKAAKAKFTRESLDTAMKGKVWGESDAFLDEHPEAYKDISVVMRDAEDLVSVDNTLNCVLNVKGD
jgi:tRNA-splicing ligase RtcB